MLHHLAPACQAGLTPDRTVDLVLAHKAPRRREVKTNLHHSPAPSLATGVAIASGFARHDGEAHAEAAVPHALATLKVDTAVAHQLT